MGPPSPRCVEKIKNMGPAKELGWLGPGPNYGLILLFIRGPPGIDG